MSMLCFVAIITVMIMYTIIIALIGTIIISFLMGRDYPQIVLTSRGWKINLLFVIDAVMRSSCCWRRCCFLGKSTIMIKFLAPCWC